MQNNRPPVPWDIGYKIEDRYEIIDIKKGGMGIVYIAHDHEWDKNHNWDKNIAIKTFQDKYLWDEEVIQRFMAEAEIWTELEIHTNIVFANFVQRIEGKPLLFLEFIDGGNLEPFIGKLTIYETLDFAIQFCTGMEYAYQNLGVIHRDIKPGNVMVQKDPRFRFGYAYKITDFGLVKVLGDGFLNDSVKVSTGMGTLPFMPPEQFPKRIQEKFSFKGEVSTRSDIYSFGVTLYLLLTGKLPFVDMNEIFTKKPERPMYLNPKIPESPDILIIKCLEKNPDKRYTDFTELKEKLVELYNDLTGERYAIVGKKETFTDLDWSNKGMALDELGKHSEAIVCFNQALEINPKYEGAWNSKGLALKKLGNLEEAIVCFNQALEINPRYEGAWNSKGNALGYLGNLQEAIVFFNQALEINPRYFEAWSNKGLALKKLGNLEEAIVCFNQALEINPRSFESWSNKGNALGDLGKHREAIICYDNALKINPRDEATWLNKGVALHELGNVEEAIVCNDKALEINPKFAPAWSNKGVALHKLGKIRQAIGCFEKFIELASPQDASQIEHAKQLINKLRG